MKRTGLAAGVAWVAASALGSVATQAARPSALAGSVVAVQEQHGVSSLALRSGNAVRLIRLTSDTQVVSADGYALQPRDIRAGDAMSVWARRIVDRSQHLVLVQGVVSFGDIDGTSLVLTPQNSAQSGKSIVADVGANTRYIDPAHITSSLPLVQDSDLVQVKGVMDDTLGEMTQTWQVVRLGPVPHH